ncbi:MAG: amidase [Parvularculaceae bacterium]
MRPGALAVLAAFACARAPEDAAAPPAPAAKTKSLAAQGLMARPLPEIAAALAAGETTSEALVTAYLDRIETVDRAGPTLQAVLTVNPNALVDARAADAKRAAGGALGTLHGVPVLLKDNIETLDPMPTTAGSLALKENVTGRDSPLVAGLRAEGAIILGKTNLSEWANFRSEDSVSGWSGLGGQVRNPHMLDRSPCGSSSGSGAAMAASLAAATVGTETNGSISCPSHVNGVVGFKPTVGLVSQQYIVPISSSQDTAGPMTKTVAGAALMLAAMDSSDVDYVGALDTKALAGKRVAVLRFAQGSNADIKSLFERAILDLKKAGAEIVEIEKFAPGDKFWDQARMVLDYEFKATLNAYLAEAAPAVTARSLGALIAFNKEHGDVELAIFDQSIFDKAAPLGDLTTAEYIAARDAVQRAAGAEGVDRLLKESGADVLISPTGPVSSRVDPVNGDVWPVWAGAGYLAAIAGYPHLTVPMGTVDGIPVGLSFIGPEGADAGLLAMGYAYEEVSQRRVEPLYLADAEARPEIGAAMRRK